MSKVIKCPKCGSAIPEKDKYCRCGAPKPVLQDNYCENPTVSAI